MEEIRPAAPIRSRGVVRSDGVRASMAHDGGGRAAPAIRYALSARSASHSS